MKRNILRNILTAAALLLSGVLSINASAQNNVSAYHQGQSSPYGNYTTLQDALANTNLNIEVTGLAKGESEVFGVYSVVDDVETLVLNIAVTGKGTGTDVSTIIRLAAGTYIVKPTTWDWAYTNSSAQSVTITDGEASTAAFTVTAKSDQPGHGEKARVNNFN